MIAVVGIVVGQDAARNVIAGQISGMMGKETAEFLQTAVANASNKSSGTLATLFGIATLIATASGVFGEMQTALNTVWKAKPDPHATLSRLVRARAVSIGLVVTLRFLLLVSLVVSAGITALTDHLNALFPFGGVLTAALNMIVSLGLTAILFAAIFKVLPDTPIAWREVIAGAVITALLFNGGKALIGWYLGSAAVGSNYGAAGGLIVLLLWVYYSAQIFLIGAEITYVYTHGAGETARRHSDSVARASYRA